jgi:predicted kinase
VRILLVTGPPGSGKTTVLERLTGILDAEGVSYAALELEALSLVNPLPDDDAAFAHLEFIARSFAERGYPNLLLTATVVDDDYLARLRAALPSDDIRIARLEAPTEVLLQRVREREPADWVGLPRLLEATAELAESIAALPGIDLVVRTAEGDPRELAASLRELV